MKKVAIITLNGLYNYGNRLQNYALQHKLTELGFDVETVIGHDRHALTFEPSIRKNERIKKAFNLMVTGQFIQRVKHKATFDKMLALKSKANQSFNQKDIVVFDLKQEQIDDLNQLNHRYDYFVVGSDQVWNPFFVQDYRLNFLTFAEPEKRLAYAASFGVAQIAEELQTFYQQNLAQFNQITVREQQGQFILKELLNEDFPLVLDPTLLLSQKEWLDFIDTEMPQQLPKAKKYLLLYFIKEPTSTQKRIIEMYAKNRQLKIVQIMGDQYDASYIVPNPKEFICYIEQAAFVFTDSFHATVFSIIMATPFFVFSRRDIDMSSRVDTLLKLLALEQHADLESLEKDDVLLKMDHPTVAEKLRQQRQFSNKILADFFTKATDKNNQT